MFCKSLLKVVKSFTINTNFAVTKSANLQAYKPNLQNLNKVLSSPKRPLKKGHQKFTTLYSIPFLSVLHQNKALNDFH